MTVPREYSVTTLSISAIFAAQSSPEAAESGLYGKVLEMTAPQVVSADVSEHPANISLITLTCSPQSTSDR